MIPTLARLVALPALLLAAACTGPGPVRISGAETAAGSARTQVVPAAVFQTGQGWQMELVGGDGTVFTGTLQERREPVIVPLAAAPSGAPLVGGGTVLAGALSGGAATLDCRLRLLNPVRGADGGGSGRCEGAGRQVEFIF